MRKIALLVIFFCTFLWGGIELKNNSKKSHHVQPLFKKLSKTDKPARYLEFHRGIRTRDNENAPQYASGYKWSELHRAKANAVSRKRNSGARTKSNGVSEWIERGPGNVPGRTRALLNIAGDVNNNAWLAGSATGGIWRTSNGGSSWTEESIEFPALPISSFASDAAATVIYAGTGEFISSVYSAIGNGIFKSIDKGQSWQQLPSTNNNPEFNIITRLIVNPADGNVILASTAPHNLSTDDTSSIMRSTDGGITWTKVKEIKGIFEQIIATPGNFNIQYASQNGAGIWKSTDTGQTWNLSSEGMSPDGRLEISVSPVSPNKIFVSAEGSLSGNQSDLYYSDNSGVTWSLVNISFNDEPIDFLEGQGFYDNTVLCDPFTPNKVYFGGVSLFTTTLGTGSTIVDTWKLAEKGTEGFIFLQSFEDIEWDHQRLTVDVSDPKITVQLRFGSGRSQRAHRFFVPQGETSGVEANNYTYQDYTTTVPFEAWDVSNPATPRQLMVSYRDQNRNGFDLVSQNLDENDPAIKHSREYLYIHSVNYNASTPNSNITVTGGHEKNLLYTIFPALAAGATWPAALPNSSIEIQYAGIAKLNASTQTVADGRGSFDNKNKSNQINLSQGVHPDHHALVPITIDPAGKTFKLLLGNDGGVFVSKVSTSPGTTEGDWLFKGLGYNTGQFYGADKRPGRDQYIGGLQDNGTRISSSTQSASAQSSYQYAIGGDGFEVLWNNKDDSKILGSVYYAQISQTTSGGNSWETATRGLNQNSTDFPFVTKLSNSKDFPDRVFTVGTKGVYISNDFGSNWALTSIPEKFVIGTGFYLDVEVSRANANIVWAGSGMTDSGGSAIRNLHVSINGGATFSTTNNFTTVELGNITKLASHPIEQNTAYALFSFSKSPKILRTTDLGQSWEDISGFGTGSTSTNGFPDVAVYCLYVRPDNPDIIWAGTEIGIVESMDNGQNWAIIDDFPNVSVWDMKGQDNQIVLATHGRGIWTAQVEADQVTGKTPAVIASGTSPLGKFVLRIQSLDSYDSLQVFSETALAETFYTVSPGTQDLEVDNITPGNRNIRMIWYKGNTPYQSVVYKAKQIDVLPPKNTYSTYFNTLNEVQVNGLTLQHFTGVTTQRQTLQTNHNYSTDREYEILLRTPVVVSGTSPILFFRDIAIVEPDQDSVIVEATRNGLDWVSLSPSYDAEYPGDQTGAWKNAYLKSRPGKSEMFIKHEINFGSHFAAGDLIMFRFRLRSGSSVTSWGWAMDYISIQEQPLGPEPSSTLKAALSIFPNPSQGKLTVDYLLEKSSDISIEVIDVYGRHVTRLNAGRKQPGFNTETFDIGENQPPGNYILIITSQDGKKVGRVTLIR